MIMTMAVIKKVQAEFPIDAQASILDILSLYGSRETEKDVERVRLLALEKAHGDADLVAEHIYAAKKDMGQALLSLLEEES